MEFLKYGMLVIFLNVLLLCSCGNEENIVVFTRSEVIRLLSNDSTKSWERKRILSDGEPGSLSDCDLFTSTQYISEMDNLIFISRTDPDYCGGSSMKLDSGSWDVLEESLISDRIDRIAYYSVNGDTTVKEIRDISALNLTTEYLSNGTSIRETYESGLPD